MREFKKWLRRFVYAATVVLGVLMGWVYLSELFRPMLEKKLEGRTFPLWKIYGVATGLGFGVALAVVFRLLIFTSEQKKKSEESRQKLREIKEEEERNKEELRAAKERITGKHEPLPRQEEATSRLPPKEE